MGPSPEEQTSSPGLAGQAPGPSFHVHPSTLDLSGPSSSHFIGDETKAQQEVGLPVLGVGGVGRGEQ